MAAITHAQGAIHSRLFMHRLGLWTFFFGETFLFGTVISSRYYLLGFERPEALNQLLGLGITALLLLSSLTAYRAETAAEHEDHGGFKLNMMLTILMGVLFMFGVGYEWYEAYRPGHFPPSSIFGTVFFTTTGIHATHVFSGVILLTIIFLKGRRPGRFTSGSYWGVEGAVKYWHFVDVAWVFIYPTLYLV